MSPLKLLSRATSHAIVGRNRRGTRRIFIEGLSSPREGPITRNGMLLRPTLSDENSIAINVDMSLTTSLPHRLNGASSVIGVCTNR